VSHCQNCVVASTSPRIKSSFEDPGSSRPHKVAFVMGAHPPRRRLSLATCIIVAVVCCAGCRGEGNALDVTLGQQWTSYQGTKTNRWPMIYKSLRTWCAEQSWWSLCGGRARQDEVAWCGHMAARAGSSCCGGGLLQLRIQQTHGRPNAHNVCWYVQPTPVVVFVCVFVFLSVCVCVCVCVCVGARVHCGWGACASLGAWPARSGHPYGRTDDRHHGLTCVRIIAS